MVYAKRVVVAAALGLALSACASASPCPCEGEHEQARSAEAKASAGDESAQRDEVDDVEAAEAMEPIVGSREEATRRVAPNDEAAIVWLAEGENAYVGEMTLAPGAAVPTHHHGSEEYLFIQEGGGVLTIEGDDHELTAGTVVAVPSNSEHSYVNGEKTTVAVQVFADPEGAQRFLEWEESEADLVDSDEK